MKKIQFSTDPMAASRQSTANSRSPNQWRAGNAPQRGKMSARKVMFPGIHALVLWLLLSVFGTTALAEGPLTNGGQHDGNIATAGQTNSWTTSANAGDRIIVQVAELSGGAGFFPRLAVFAPDGTPLGSSFGEIATRLDIQAATSGDYLVVVSDAYQTGAGSYRLWLAQMPEAFSVPASDEGGSLTNGANYTGTHCSGGFGLCGHFQQIKGDRIALQVAKTSGNVGFQPMIELFTPNGTRLEGASDPLAARLDVEAPDSGTYTVLISAGSPDGSGGYQLQLAQAPEVFVVPDADEGGPLADGVDQDGTIAPGDFDLWTFVATPVDHVNVSITELSGGLNFFPKIELFGPNGEFKGTAQDAASATIDAATELAGTYTILISDANRAGHGTYRLNLTRSTIAPAGANVLVNGTTALGAIAVVGESNSWTFTASAGDSIVVRAGLLTSTGGTQGFTPKLQLYGPDDMLLDADGHSYAATEVTTRATNSGTFTVVVSDGGNYVNGTGTYRVELAKTGSPILVGISDEGGSLTNGVMYLEGIDVGDVDVWNFTANAGEYIVVRSGRITNISGNQGFTPWLRLYGPDGALLSSDGRSYLATEVATRATNSGTFTVVVTDGGNYPDGAGTCRLTLTKTGSPIVIGNQDEGGSMTNGLMHVAAIDTGDLDVWNFIANAGQSIVVRAGEVTSTGGTQGFTPGLRLFGPDGALLDSDGGGYTATEVFIRATNSGMFSLVVGDGGNYTDGDGTYRLTLAKTGSDVWVSPQDEGGAMTNDVMHLGSIDTGDLDLWRFTANAGDSIVVRAGEISTQGFTPGLRLFGPDGALLDSDGSGYPATEVTVRATNSGTFMVVVVDGGSYPDGVGTYRLTLGKTDSAIVVSTQDEGGPLTNGWMHVASIDTGDLDVWNFTADAGESIVVRAGRITNTGGNQGFTPWLRLYGPDGARLDGDGSSYTATEVTVRATNSGTFVVMVADGGNYPDGVGTYRLKLAKTGSEVVIAPSDQGGPLANGATELGTIDTGDVDVWSFLGTVGQTLVLRAGEIMDHGGTQGFTPALRLYGPDGALLKSVFTGYNAVELSTTATNSGMFTVVASDGGNYPDGAGTYQLTLIQVPGTFAISAGDDGGPMTNQVNFDGTITTGDVDTWSFNACEGDNFSLQLDKVTASDTLKPEMRLYAPDGTLLKTAANATSAQIILTAAMAGTYTVVVSDSTTDLSGTGAYQLSGTGISSGLTLCPLLVDGTNLVVRAIGGPLNGGYVLLTTTDITTPADMWTPIWTNQFSSFGVFAVTNFFDVNQPQQYFRLQLP